MQSVNAFLNRPVAAAVVAIALFVGLDIFSMPIASAFTSDLPTCAFIATLIMQGVCIAYALLVLVWAKAPSPVTRKYTFTAPYAIAFALILALSVFVVWFAGTVVATAVMVHLGDPGASDYSEVASQLSMWYVLVATLVAPVTEELVFRGIVYGRFCATRLPVVVCAFISASLFALVHGTLGHLAPTFLLGLLLCWAYSRSGGRIWVCVVMHMCYNVLSLTVGAAGFEIPDAFVTPVASGILFAVATGVLLVLCSTVGKPSADEDAGRPLPELEEGYVMGASRCEELLASCVTYASCLVNCVTKSEWERRVAHDGGVEPVVPSDVSALYGEFRGAHGRPDADLANRVMSCHEKYRTRYIIACADGDYEVV